MEGLKLNRLRDYMPKNIPGFSSWSAESSEGQAAEETPLPEPQPKAGGPKSYLDLLDECDSFPYYQTNPKLYFAHINTYYALYVQDFPETELGYVLPSVAAVFRGLPNWTVDDEERSLTLVAGHTEAERTHHIEATTLAMKATGHFRVLAEWRGENYPVYGPRGEVLFHIERAASPLLGVATYGAHMTAYTRGPDGQGEMQIWVPRRAAHKSTYGGMLDNTVAGGIAVGESPFECLVRESAEEASLPEDMVRKGARAAGTVSYFHIRDHRAGGETRLLQPECQYVYDLELPHDFTPAPCDNEVEGFELKTVEEVKQALHNAEFKPNCALVLLDFFVRHGFLTIESDPGYNEIISRLHRRLEFPLP